MNYYLNYVTLFIQLIINNVIVINLIGSSIIYSLSICIYGSNIITQGDRIRTWVPNTDTPIIYGIKILNTILKSQ